MTVLTIFERAAKRRIYAANCKLKWQQRTRQIAQFDHAPMLPTPRREASESYITGIPQWQVS